MITFNFKALSLQPILLGFIVALIGAYLAIWLHIPLPWLLGPLLFTAIVKQSKLVINCNNPLRFFGQWTIGVTLGLYFTPAVVMLIIANYPALLIGMLWAVLLCFFSSWMLYYFAKVDFATAWFSAATGGSSEMAVLAENYHAKIDKVATSHSLRLLLVVTILSFCYQWLNITGDNNSILNSNNIFDAYYFIALISLTLLMAFIFLHFKIPNAFVLGPLLVVALLTVCEIHLSIIPLTIQNLGQLCLGWALGNRFKSGFFKKNPHFILICTATHIFALILTILLVLFISHFIAISPATLMLGLAPGGISEMTLTAKSLQLDVALVTIFHVSRVIFVLLITAPLYLWISRSIKD